MPPDDTGSETRVALITGGGGRIGAAIARRLANAGLRIVVADRDGAAAESVAKTLAGAPHRGVAVDVTSEAAVSHLFDRAMHEVGPIAVLVAAAAILSPQLAFATPTIADTGLEEWNDLLAVNATGTFLCIRELARRNTFKSLRHGRIVTISSGAAQQGGITSGIAYSASKGAIFSIAKSAARELAPLGITVNCVAPGPIDSPMLDRTYGAYRSGSAAEAYATTVPLGRVGRPEEIAEAVAYLVSPLADFVTGATLDVNGGVVMR